MRPSFGARRQARKVGQDDNNPREGESVSEYEDNGTNYATYFMKHILTCVFEQIG